MNNDESVIAILDRELNIRKYQKILLDKCVLTPTKLFSTTLQTLSFQTNVPIDICEQVQNTVAKNTVPPITTVQYYEPKPRFYDPILDKFLPMPESGIVELCGQASAGKSNIVYHLAIQERIHDPSRKVVIISTEGRVPLNRIRQIAECTESSFSADDIMNGILITEADTVDQLSEKVQTDLVNLFFAANEPPPSMVVIDSIASLFRIEYNISNSPERTRILFDITATLKWISATNNTLILVTNQATANMSSFSTNSNDWIPSLGYSWSNCINIRMRVTKTSLKHQISTLDTPIRTTPDEKHNFPSVVPVRTIYVEISPIKQNARTEFYIDNSGVHGL